MKRERNKVKKLKKEKQKEAGWGIAGVTVLFFLLFTVRFLINLVRKVSPFGKTETEALIFDNYSDTTYHKFEESTYEFTVAFEDKNGNNISVFNSERA
ncbi:hypothetical protein DVB69_00105 [Sporosarcina sp. BI001-red]|nr:hypothetical protein DVB69_00105 [Sporosarcina sp. BI001-red]